MVYGVWYMVLVYGMYYVSYSAWHMEAGVAAKSGASTLARSRRGPPRRIAAALLRRHPSALGMEDAPLGCVLTFCSLDGFGGVFWTCSLIVYFVGHIRHLSLSLPPCLYSIYNMI